MQGKVATCECGSKFKVGPEMTPPVKNAKKVKGEPKQEMKICPLCKKTSPLKKNTCVCGYDFEKSKGTSASSLAPSGTPVTKLLGLLVEKLFHLLLLVAIGIGGYYAYLYYYGGGPYGSSAADPLGTKEAVHGYFTERNIPYSQVDNRMPGSG
ncbi:MAG: hypothetical protein HQL31_13225, partial [Planctomycetes bacterium]|nr:hypothetical protein [Planctomycetota bacterium]